MTRRIPAILALGLLASPAWAQSQGTDLGDRFQIDVGYFNIKADALLRYNGPQTGSGEVDLESDLGQDQQVNTFWVDGTWRMGRRHQLKLSFTQLDRERANYPLERTFVWGGKTYTAGLNATSTSGSEVWGGYYRFALVRNDKFEIGPSLGVGYLTVRAGIKATATISGGAGSPSGTLDESASRGTVTGAVGGYAALTPLKRLVLLGDYLYIKANISKTEVSVTDWRLSANYYFYRAAGLGVQYKYYRYTLDREIVSSDIGGQVEYQGVQAFLTFRF